MRQHQVPLPCVQEIAAQRRKRVQPSFYDWREAWVGLVLRPAYLRRTHDPDTSSGRYRSAPLESPCVLSSSLRELACKRDHPSKMKITILPSPIDF